MKSVRKTSYRGRNARAGERLLASKMARMAGISMLRQPTRRLAAGEFKSISIAPAGFTADYSGAAVLLNGIARGDDIDARNGRQITMRSVEISGQVTNAVPAGTPVPTIIRVLLVYDRQTNGAALTPAMVLEYVGSVAATHSPRNLAYRERFTTLNDIKIPLSASTVADYRDGPTPFKIYRRFTLPETFNAGNAGTVADIATGSMYLVVISDQAAAPLPTCYFVSRIRYEDK